MLYSNRASKIPGYRMTFETLIKKYIFEVLLYNILYNKVTYSKHRDNERLDLQGDIKYIDDLVLSFVWNKSI